MLENKEWQEEYRFLNEYTNPVKKAERKIEGRDQEIEKILSAFMRPELCNVILLGDAGSGKGHRPTDWIAVDDDRHFIQFKDIKVGDRVFSENGDPISVSGVFPQGLKDIYNVHYKDGTCMPTNEEHLMEVRSKRSHKFDKGFRTMSLRDILDSNKGVKKDDQTYWYIPRNKPVQRKQTDVGINPYDYGFNLMNKMVDGLRISRIEDSYLYGSISQRFDFLRGVLDNRARIEIRGKLNIYLDINGNIEFVESFRELLWSLGIRHGLEENNGCFTIHLKVIDLEKKDLFRDLNKQSIINDYILNKKNKNQKPYKDIGIDYIEKTDKQEEIICIMVDSPTHLYQVGREYIVTHNTALVQGCMLADHKRKYLEVDLAKMIASLADSNEMAHKLKQLFDEASTFSMKEDIQLVLFIDEFHQIVQLSDAAVEVLKPLLADSGTRGIRFVAATTYPEYLEFISSNQPLVERLQRINLVQPGRDLTIKILRGFSQVYGVEDQFPDDRIFGMIYDYTNKYIPANSQPRKSILVLDTMVGWHRFKNIPLDEKLLGDVIYMSEGINVAFRVDAVNIKKKLDEKVFAQDYATTAVQKRLQLCVAGFNNDTKPMSSFLLTGSTGVGKTELTKQLAELLFEDSRSLIRFDMTEFANPSSLERFREELTSKVWARPYCIILLDEVEKACAEVTRVLLSILDDGRLTNRNNREVSFLNSYIVLTTNAGSEIYKEIGQYHEDDKGSGESLKKFEKLIRKSIIATTGDGKFPPELLGRIDTVVPFQPLAPETMAKIVKNRLIKLAKMVDNRYGIKLRFHKVDDLISYLIYDRMDSDSDAGGARTVVSKVESEVYTTVAEYINAHPTFKEIAVTVEGETSYSDKTRLESKAYVKVLKVDSNNTVD